MVDVCVNLGNSFHVITFHILSSGTDIILGLEFLQHTQCIFDCMAKMLYVRRLNTTPEDDAARLLTMTPPGTIMGLVEATSHTEFHTILTNVEVITEMMWRDGNEVNSTSAPRQFNAYEREYTPMESDVEPETAPPTDVRNASPLCALHMTTNKVKYPKPSSYEPIVWDLSKSCIDDRQKEELESVLAQHRGAFAIGMEELGHCHLIDVELSLTEGARPKLIKPYRESLEQEEIIKTQIDKWLKYDIIEPAESNWRHSLVLVRKPHTVNQFRVCSDVRYINANTVSFHYPMPDLNKILAQIGGQRIKYYTKLDLGSAYHQLDMHPNARHVTGFSCSAGAFRYKRACFGLKNLPAIFTKLMDAVLGEAQGQYVSAFIDDILVYSKTWEEHLVHVADVLTRLEDAGLTASPSKTTLAVDKIQYIGHIVSTNGVTADGENVEKIKYCESPTSLKECRQAIGLLSYYRRLIPGFAQLCKALHDCTKNPSELFLWTPEAEVNFQLLKTKLITAPILGLPDFQSSHPFQLYCDASGTGCGYVLTQVQPDPLQPESANSVSTLRNIERVIMYGGAAWSDVQKRYSTIEQEMLSIIVAVRKLHPYLFNRLTVLYTDCKSLKFIFHNTKILNDKVMRWVLTLAQYQLLVMHIAGKENVTSDYLSRMPQKNTVEMEDVMRVPLYSLEGLTDQDDMLCDRDIWENFNITVGYIERYEADILVNATNTELSPRGGVDKALQMAGGPQLLKHCRQIGYCGEGEIVITPGYDLPCKFVAHVVGPKAHQSAQQLEQCYIKCYEALEQLGCSSVCFPCISCGVFGFDPEIAARVAVKTSIAWLREHKRKIDITFLMHPRDKENLRLYEQLLRQISQPYQQTLPKRRAIPLSKMTSVPVSNAVLQITLQEKFDTECDEDTHPVLVNFGQLHVIPPTSTLKDIIEWSSDLERELIASEPINDEICVVDEVVTVEEEKDLWQIDPVQIAKDQRTDPDWKIRIDKLTDDVVPIGLPKNKIFQLLSTINDYVVQPNELLYRVWNKNQQRGKINAVMQLCLPEKHRNAVIANAHQNGHFGALKVYLRLRESYYWPSMFKDIKALIEMCKVCQYANSRAHKRVPLNPADVPSGPLEDVHLDILRISAPSNGMNYIVVMICAFSRLTRCVAVKHKTAENTANAFYRGWLSVYGAPLKLSIYSDCGLEFKGAVFQCLLKSYGLRSIFTNYYSPSTNGICERLNRTILSVLRRLVDNHPRDWANHLDACTNAVNSSISVSTNYSPFELIHGMKIRQPNQIIPPLLSPDTPLNEQEAIEFWKDRMDTIRSEATAIMEQAQIDQKEQYDKHTGKTQLAVGDLCAKIVERFPKEGSKMVHKYEGVFEVKRFTSATNVELFDIEKEVMHPRFLHVNKLKKIHQGRTQPADYVGLSLKDIQPAVNDRVNEPADLADILNKSATQDNADLLEESYLRNGFYRNTNAPTRIMTRSQTQLSDLREDESEDEDEDGPILTVPLRQPVQREVRFDHLPLPARCLRPEPATPGVPTKHKTLVPKGHQQIVPPASTPARPLLESFESYPDAVRSDESLKSDPLPPHNERVRSPGTPPAAIPVMEPLESRSDSERSASPLSSEQEAEPLVETSFHEISKIIGKKTDKDGIDWFRVKWKKHPSKKYNSWVRASDITKTFATQTSLASSSDEEVSLRVHERSLNVSVPVEVSSGSEELDETVIPSKQTQSVSPDAASTTTPVTEAERERDPFASRSRLAQSPLPSRKPKVSTPLPPSSKVRTSTPSGDTTSTDMEGWNLTRVSDTTINTVWGSLDPKDHLKRMEAVLHDRAPAPPTKPSPYYHQVIEFFNDLPIIQEFLQLEFTTQMQLALTGARKAVGSRNQNSTPWMTYAHTKHPFASFFIMGTAIESNVYEMGVSTDKRFKTLENIFQYYKARISGNLRIALACRYCPPKEARQLTSEENLLIPDIDSWDRASKGTMLTSIATSIVSRPLILELLLGSAGHHLGLLGTSKKWSCGRIETELTDKDPEFDNIHGSSYEILRELYLLAHVGSFSVRPETLHTKALVKRDSPCPTITKATTLLEEGKQLCQQMIWCEARIGYLLQRYNVVTEGPGILRPDAYYPHDPSCDSDDPLGIGKEVNSPNSAWNRRVVGDFLMKMMFENDA